MEGHYIAFCQDSDGLSVELLRIYPSLFRREYAPMASDEVQQVGGFVIKTMEMLYQTTTCICNLSTHIGTRVMVEAIPNIIGDSLDNGDIYLKIMPAGIQMDVNLTYMEHGDMVEMKKIIFNFFPDIITIHNCSFQDLIDSQRRAIRTLITNDNRVAVAVVAQQAPIVPNLPTVG